MMEAEYSGKKRKRRLSSFDYCAPFSLFYRLSSEKSYQFVCSRHFVVVLVPKNFETRLNSCLMVSSLE